MQKILITGACGFVGSVLARALLAERPGLALVGLIWASTFLVQVPLHEVLARGFDAEAHSRLVASNWLRTFLWSARAVLVLGLASTVLTLR